MRLAPLSLPLLLLACARPEAVPRNSRADLLRLLGIPPGANPDLQPGLHGARVASMPPTPSRLLGDDPRAGQGTVICQIFIQGDGSVDKVIPRYGPAHLHATAVAHARQWRFEPEAHPEQVFPIYLRLEFRPTGGSLAVDRYLSAVP